MFYIGGCQLQPLSLDTWFGDLIGPDFPRLGPADAASSAPTRPNDFHSKKSGCHGSRWGVGVALRRNLGQALSFR